MTTSTKSNKVKAKTTDMEWIDISRISALKGLHVESAISCGVDDKATAIEMAEILAERIRTCEAEGKMAK